MAAPVGVGEDPLRTSHGERGPGASHGEDPQRGAGGPGAGGRPGPRAFTKRLVSGSRGSMVDLDGDPVAPSARSTATEHRERSGAPASARETAAALLRRGFAAAGALPEEAAVWAAELELAAWGAAQGSPAQAPRGQAAAMKTYRVDVRRWACLRDGCF